MKKVRTYFSFFLVLFIIIIYLIQFHFHPIYSITSNNIQTDNKSNQIDICCTWGHQLDDGILTYQISNARPELKAFALSAVNYWDQNIEGVQFKEANSKKQVDIKISFRNDNGKVAGQTMTNFDSDGFIFNVKILLAEKAFGKQLNKNIIEYIAKHEFGHALGIGHANFKESLMSSLVYNSFNKITDCEREAVKEANDWKLIDNDSSPERSKIKIHVC
jgi:hypothetical protein